MTHAVHVDNVTSAWIGNVGNATMDNDDNDNYNSTYDNDQHDDDATRTSVARHAAVALVRYLFPVIVLVGTTCNALSAAVMLRRRMRATSIYCYLLIDSCRTFASPNICQDLALKPTLTLILALNHNPNPNPDH